MEKNQLTTKNYFTQDSVRRKFEELLGNRAVGFVTSVLQTVASNDMLSKADPATVFHAAATAATLDLPINQNLGFAYIIPYNSKQKDGSFRVVAQFQMGYKGFIQLAQRSGQFKTISATPIYEGQLISQNPLTGFVFDFTVLHSPKIIGYAAYFELLNGFQKTMYMTTSELKRHGTKFSKSFEKGYGLWKDDFDSMAVKTVIKLLLSKYAPLSIEMKKAVISDQSIINNVETDDVTYIDNDATTEDIKEIAQGIKDTNMAIKVADKIKDAIKKQPTQAQLDLDNEQALQDQLEKEAEQENK